MTLVYPVASGKGGVGKTVFVANLGVALALKRKTVVVIDLDLGGSNLHTCFGIKNKHPGLGAFAYRKETSLAALLVETGIERLYIIPGDGLIPGSANIPYFIKSRMIQGIAALNADFIILDLGAGTSYNIIDFFIESPAGIVAAAPEVTSILNAYSLLKNTVFRILLRSYPAKSAERKAIIEFVSQRIEGTPLSFFDLIGRLKEVDPASPVSAEERIRGLHPKMILNMVRGRQDLAVGAKLKEMTQRHLGIEVEFLGVLPWDNAVHESVRARSPLMMNEPDSPFSRGVKRIAERLLLIEDMRAPALFEIDEDLETLKA